MWIWMDSGDLVNLDEMVGIKVSNQDGKWAVEAVKSGPTSETEAAFAQRLFPLGTFDTEAGAQEALGELAVAIDKGDRLFTGFLPPDEG